MDRVTATEPSSQGGLTYEAMMDLMDEVYQRGGGEAGDRIEMARWPDETRAQAKSRLMSEVYAADMRAKYHRGPREFVQTDGRPYSTHNAWHFTNRYGMVSNVPAYRIGIFKEVPMECARQAERAHLVREANRVLSR